MEPARPPVMTGSGRSLVLVLGQRPLDQAEFNQRGLTLRSVQVDDIAKDDDLLNQSCGILLAHYPGKYGLLNDFFQAGFRRACEFGLLTSFASSEQADLDQFIALRDQAYSGPGSSDWMSVTRWTHYDAQLTNVAEKLARHAPGPELGQAEIETLDPSLVLCEATKKLLKRVFWDCSKLVVEALHGGKTARGTYRVFASMIGPLYGPQPLPFFVKIGTPAMIEDEKENYRKRAEPFIPFHLRPTLNPSRCVTTYDLAALVCDFVGSAVSLRQAWRNAQGAGTLFSLFEVTLRGLRAHTARAPEESGAIKAFLVERVKAIEIHTAPDGALRIARAKELGLSREPEEIEQILIAHAERLESRRGTYHGDMHCGNVMVRHQDAIVIDFGSMRDFGPLTADPSFMEVSLVFGADDDDDPKRFGEWVRFVDDLFQEPLHPPILDSEHLRFAWLRRAVRELRHIVSCCGIKRAEGLIVLAGCLLRYGRLSRLEYDTPELVQLSEDRRAYALVIADRLCAKLHANATS